MPKPVGRLLVALLMLCGTLAAQESSSAPGSKQSAAPAPPASPQPAPPAAASREIILDVQVSDKSHKPVTGLEKDDFIVLDNKARQPIDSFYEVKGHPPAPTDPAVEVILVVDSVNAGVNAVSFERNQIKNYLLRDGGELPHPTSLIVLTDLQTLAQQGYSKDGKALAALYDQYETGIRVINRSQGVYGDADRLSISLKALNSISAYLQKAPGRKLVIWISPGWPMLSGPGITFPKNDIQQFYRSIVGISGTLRQARITLYAIDPLGLADAGSSYIDYYKEFLKPVTNWGRAEPGNLALQVLAVQSGGAVYNSSNDLTASIADCVADATSYYTLSFPSQTAKSSDEYHSLEVKIEKPGLTARTRSGYYAQP